MGGQNLKLYPREKELLCELLKMLRDLHCGGGCKKSLFGDIAGQFFL